MIRTVPLIIALALALAAGAAHANKKANAIARAAERTYSPEAYRTCDGYRAGSNQRLLCLERFERKRLAAGEYAEEWSGSQAERFCQALPGSDLKREACLANPRRFGYRGGRQ